MTHGRYNQLEEIVNKKDDEIAALTRQLGQTSVSNLFVEDTSEVASASSLFADPEKENLIKQVAQLEAEVAKLKVTFIFCLVANNYQAAKPAAVGSPTPSPELTAENRQLKEYSAQLAQQLTQLQQDHARISGLMNNMKNEHAQAIANLKAQPQGSPQPGRPDQVSLLILYYISLICVGTTITTVAATEHTT